MCGPASVQVMQDVPAYPTGRFTPAPDYSSGGAFAWSEPGGGVRPASSHGSPRHNGSPRHSSAYAMQEQPYSPRQPARTRYLHADDVDVTDGSGVASQRGSPRK